MYFYIGILTASLMSLANADPVLIPAVELSYDSPYGPNVTIDEERGGKVAVATELIKLGGKLIIDEHKGTKIHFWEYRGKYIIESECWEDGSGPCANGNCLDYDGPRGMKIQEISVKCAWFCFHMTHCRRQTCCPFTNKRPHTAGGNGGNGGNPSTGTVGVGCQSGNGENYSGSTSKTRSGYTCQKWTSQSPHIHRFGSLGNHNNCRNPDGEPGVWCYTTNPNKRWELCDVPVCVCDGKDSGCCTSRSPCGVDDGDCDSNSDCQTGLICGTNNCPNKGKSHTDRNTWDRTDDCCTHPACGGKDSGCCTPSIPCGVDDGDCDSDRDCKAGLICGTNNCPNKGKTHTDRNTWDRTDDCCTHPPVGCQNGDGKDYSGGVMKTRSGLTCQKWTSQWPHKHGFGSLGNHNYCRNPDGEPGVWCYTTNPNKRWELCAVPACG